MGATNDRYLRTLIRIKKRRSRHNDLHANTKTVVGHVETALSDIVTNTDQQAQKVLNDANAHADQITAAATTRFEEQHQELDDKHTTLTDVVNTNKDETDAAITAAEEKTTTDITEAKAELNGQFETANAEIKDMIVANQEAVDGHKNRINRVRTRAKVLTDRVKGDCNDRTMDARVAHIGQASNEADINAIKQSYADLEA